jgi:hypothetical protein
MTTSAVGEVSIRHHDPATGAVTAAVQGKARVFIVDHDPDFGPDWWCTCTYGPDCSHIKRTKRALEGDR